jgi:tetratricopeptide (TPR) repeat protein
MSHYCSVECQKLHWKAHKPICIPIAVTRKKISDAAKQEENKRNIRLSNITSSTPALEKANVYGEMGRFVDFNDMVYNHHLRVEPEMGDDDTTTTTLMNPVIHDWIHDARRQTYCPLAQEQLNIALQSDPTNVGALLTKAYILRYMKPQETIDALQEVLRRDQMGVRVEEAKKKRDKFLTCMNNTLTKDEIMDKNHPMVCEWTRLQEEVRKLLLVSKKDGVLINDGPYRLYEIKIHLAEAYELVGEYEKAAKIYKAMVQESYEFQYQGFGSLDGQKDQRIKRGGSRCCLATKDYEKAQKMAQMLLNTNRRTKGAHILLAQAQWAMNNKKGAIRTMCRAVLYEAPWDDNNQEMNRIYLQEFVDAMGETD